MTKQKGVGTYVRYARVRSWLLQEWGGFFLDELVRSGRHVASRRLRGECTELPGWAADALGRPPDSEGVVIERLRAVDGLVALYVINHLPLEFASTVLSLDNPLESFYQRLEREHGIRVGGARRVLEAAPAGDQLAGLLEVDRFTPLAFIESVSWDSSLRPFDCYRAWVRTNRLKIEVRASSTAAHEPLAVHARVDDLRGTSPS